MTEAHKLERPQMIRGGLAGQPVDPRVTAQSAVDPRVSMVLEVLGGRHVEHVAQDWEIESSLLHRWVRDFLVAGTAVVTNRPDPEEARQRDRFLAAFTHELRTPVTIASGWAMVLSDGDVPADEVADSLEHLTEAIARLSTHILDVELAASVSLGRLRVRSEPVPVADLCGELPGCAGVRKGADLTVLADKRLLSRVLRDLWTTAHRDPAPGHVAIDVVDGTAWQEIRVVREGAPIGPMVLKALFDPFGANDDNTGVTMGLYMARALTVAHGGILAAEGDDDHTVLIARLPSRTQIAPQPTGLGRER
jgi:signal transduction histidine kinase